LLAPFRPNAKAASSSYLGSLIVAQITVVGNAYLQLSTCLLPSPLHCKLRQGIPHAGPNPNTASVLCCATEFIAKVARSQRRAGEQSSLISMAYPDNTQHATCRFIPRCEDGSICHECRCLLSMRIDWKKKKLHLPATSG